METGEKETETKELEAYSKGSPLKYWILVIVYLGLIFLLSSLSYIPFITTISEMDPRKFSLHILEYLGLGFLVYLAFLNSGFGRGKSLAAALVLCFSVAYVDETYQLSIPGRRFNPLDMYADYIGALIGTFIARFLTRSKKLVRS